MLYVSFTLTMEHFKFGFGVYGKFEDWQTIIIYSIRDWAY